MIHLLDNIGLERILGKLKSWIINQIDASILKQHNVQTYEYRELRKLVDGEELIPGKIYRLKYPLKHTIFTNSNISYSVNKEIFLLAIAKTSFSKEVRVRINSYYGGELKGEFDFNDNSLVKAEPGKCIKLNRIGHTDIYSFTGTQTTQGYQYVGHNGPDTGVYVYLESHDSETTVDGIAILERYDNIGGRITYLEDRLGNKCDFDNIELRIGEKKVIQGRNNIVKSDIDFGYINGDDNVVESGCSDIGINGDNNIIKNNCTNIAISGSGNIIEENCKDVCCESRCRIGKNNLKIDVHSYISTDDYVYGVFPDIANHIKERHYKRVNDIDPVNINYLGIKSINVTAISDSYISCIFTIKAPVDNFNSTSIIFGDLNLFDTDKEEGVICTINLSLNKITNYTSDGVLYWEISCGGKVSSEDGLNTNTTYFLQNKYSDPFFILEGSTTTKDTIDVPLTFIA